MYNFHYFLWEIFYLESTRNIFRVSNNVVGNNLRDELKNCCLLNVDDINNLRNQL